MRGAWGDERRAGWQPSTIPILLADENGAVLTDENGALLSIGDQGAPAGGAWAGGQSATWSAESKRGAWRGGTKGTWQ